MTDRTPAAVVFHQVSKSFGAKPILRQTNSAGAQIGANLFVLRAIKTICFK